MSFGSALKKRVEKFDSKTIHLGFEDESKLQWVGLGNFAMNKLISGKYKYALPFGRSLLIGGESGSGKSLILAEMCEQAQKKHDAHIVWLDAENASRKPWLKDLGVNTDEDKMTYMNVATIEDVKKLISDIVELVDNSKTPPFVVVVVDSWSNLVTEKQYKEARSGKVVGDQGQQAKQLKDLIKSATHLITRRPILVTGVVHTYDSQDQFSPGEKFSGGRGLMYLASLAFLFQKYKLKTEDVDMATTSTSKYAGTRCKVNLFKSRFSKPNEEVEVQLVYPHGLDVYSGLFDYMEENKEIEKVAHGGWYSAIMPEGVQRPDTIPEKFQKNKFRDIADELMEIYDSVSEADLQESFDEKMADKELDEMEEELENA